MHFGALPIVHRWRLRHFNDELYSKLVLTCCLFHGLDDENNFPLNLQNLKFFFQILLHIFHLWRSKFLFYLEFSMALLQKCFIFLFFFLGLTYLQSQFLSWLLRLSYPDVRHSGQTYPRFDFINSSLLCIDKSQFLNL